MLYYEEENVRLYNCDWRDLDPKLLLADGLICDPPYGLGEAAGKNASRGKPFGSLATNSRSKAKAYVKDYGDDDWDSEPPSAEDIAGLCALAKHQIIWGGNYFHLPPSRCWLVWDKVNGSCDFADCELAWTNLDKAVRKFQFMWNGMLRDGDDVRVHPTQKPKALMAWCLTMLPQDVKSVVDPYAGSGTVAVACKAMGISCISVEREKKYCDEIVDRLRQKVFEFS